MKFFMFFIFFLLLGGFFIIAEQGINLSNEGGIEIFFVSYGRWIEGLINNSQSVSGYVVKMDWLPSSEADG